MRIIENDPKHLHLESRGLSSRHWLIGGLIFLPGLAALLWLPEAYRWVGLLAWMVIWLAGLALAPRWIGDRVRVSVDSPNRTIVWTRNEQVTQSVKFADVQRFDILPLSVASRPYKAYQLVAQLKNNTRITLAVDPKQAHIERVLKLVRERMRTR